jgi:hypothetical protein
MSGTPEKFNTHLRRTSEWGGPLDAAFTLCGRKCAHASVVETNPTCSNCKRATRSNEAKQRKAKHQGGKP